MSLTTIVCGVGAAALWPRADAEPATSPASEKVITSFTRYIIPPGFVRIPQQVRWPRSIPHMRLSLPPRRPVRNLLNLGGGNPHVVATLSSQSTVYETEAVVDEFWAKLSAGGHKDQCGWLQDKFGLSWQVVPAKAF